MSTFLPKIIKKTMKVGELREKLAKLEKKEIIQIASEFYKLIPKAKKEDYDLDSYINNPSSKTKKNTTRATLTLEDLDEAVTSFIESARALYYLMPNRVVPKKERSTWRFKVKKWHKELTNTKRKDKDLAKQSKLLTNLYELLCEACTSQYFTAYDPFQSVGVEQTVFYHNVIALLHEEKGKLETVRKSIELIMNNSLNRYTLYSSLMEVLIATYESSDLKYKAIEISEKMIHEIDFKPKEKKKKNAYWPFNRETYYKREKNNNLAELGLRLYISLYEVQEGIDFYYKYYRYERDEVKLYILIVVLFQKKEKAFILAELEKAQKQGIKLRDNLVKLLNEIKKNDALPRFL